MSQDMGCNAGADAPDLEGLDLAQFSDEQIKRARELFIAEFDAREKQRREMVEEEMRRLAATIGCELKIIEKAARRRPGRPRKNASKELKGQDNDK